MKTLYFLFALGSFAVIAQDDWTYSTGKDVDEVIPSDTYSNVDIYMTTPTPETIRFNWEVVSNTLPTGWIATLCDHAACYTSIPDDGIMDEISMSEATDGLQGFLKITCNPGTIYGTGVVKFYVYDSNDYNRGDTVSFTLTNLNSLNVAENELNVSVYPNPVAHSLNLENNSHEALTYEMFNISGSKVGTGAIPSQTTKQLDVSVYPEGIYFLSLTLPSGARKTEKVVIK